MKPAFVPSTGLPNRDNITILLPVRHFTASKRIELGPDGKIEINGYNAGRDFGVLTYEIDSIVSLSKLLTIAERKNCLVIRGEPEAHVERNGNPVRRRKTVNFSTPLIGRRPVMIDCDKIPLPPGVLLAKDEAEVRKYLISLLPSEFHDASYHWQLSSSAGFTDPSVVSMHLWFWLDRTVRDAELKRWAKDWNTKAGRKIIDPALFNDVQAHYIAAPTFGKGVVDPFPVRSGLVRKSNDSVAIELPAVTAAPQVKPKSATKRVTTSAVHASGGFETILGQIGDHDGGDGFHDPIIRAVASYVATHDPSEIDVEALYEVVRARVLAADRSHHEDSYIERMAGREHIIRAIEGAITKFGNTDSPRRKSRRIEGIPPHFTSKPSAITEATAQLQSVIDKFVG